VVAPPGRAPSGDVPRYPSEFPRSVAAASFFLFSWSAIGFASPSPTASQLVRPRHRLQQHRLLHLLRRCNWRGIRRNRNACLCCASSSARPSMPTRCRHHLSGDSTIDIIVVISDSHVVGLINRSRANHPPETFVIHRAMLCQARGSSLCRLLRQQHRRLSSTNAVASTSSSTSSVRVSRAQFEQDVRHMRATPAHPLFCVVGPPACNVNTLCWCCACPRRASHRAPLAPLRLISYASWLSPPRLQEPRCVATPTSSLLPAHPRRQPHHLVLDYFVYSALTTVRCVGTPAVLHHNRRGGLLYWSLEMLAHMVGALYLVRPVVAPPARAFIHDAFLGLANLEHASSMAA
jgi:hypothetical protein